MRNLLDTVAGLSDLLLLFAKTGFRLRSPYWQWRLHTAFGRGYPSKREFARGMLEYARWVSRMRRAARG